MKARITAQREPERVLYYPAGEQEEKIQALSQTAGEMGIQLVLLTGEDFAQKLGFLAGAAGYQKREGNGDCSPGQELMILSLPQEKVNRFLSALDGKNVPKVPLKAVVTPHNRDWTLSRLVEEIGREHLLFEAYEKLQAAAKLARQAVQEGRIPKEKGNQLSLLLAKAKGISSLESCSQKELEKLTGEIQAYLE